MKQFESDQHVKCIKIEKIDRKKNGIRIDNGTYCIINNKQNIEMLLMRK